ncbi:MAG: iron-sulfur cluster assembly scaffold protein [Planctomycetes bacterium]|nr:iron-sulfur cluster assembly scaffold protein [Planctomycetota bacterium]
MKFKEELRSYPPIILKHFMDPKHIGSFTKPTFTLVTSNKGCNDMIKSYILCDSTTLSIKIKVFGCAITIATASMVAELLQNKPFYEILKLPTTTFKKELIKGIKGIPADRLKCIEAACEMYNLIREELKNFQK